MAKFKITPTTTVAELKEQFRNEVGCVLRVYQGRSEAPDGATLVSLGAKEGELECRTSRTVGKFEEAFQNELNLKVKVYTKDNWVKVLDGITLAVAGQLPNGMTKAKMEEHLSYKRDEEETAEVVNEEDSESVEIPEEYKGILLIDINFAKVDLPEDENSYEDYAKEIFGNNNDGIAVLYHGVPDDDQYAVVYSEDERSYDWLMYEAKKRISKLPDGEESTLYLSSSIDFYSEDGEEDLYSCSNIVGVALNEFCDGGNKHEYSYDWEEEYKNGKAIVRVNFGNGSCIFIAYANGGIEMLDLSDEQFDYLTRKAVLDSDIKYHKERELFTYKQHGKVGYINREAQLAIPPKFDDARDFYDGLAVAEINGKYGYIDSDGNIVVEPKFDYASNFGGGLAQVKNNGKNGFIDKNGNFVLEPEFDTIYSCKNTDGERLYVVSLDDKWGIMNGDFEYIVRPTFLSLSSFKGGYASAQSAENELFGMVNSRGEFVLKPQYRKITNFYEQNGNLVIFAVTVENEKIKIDINGNIIP